MIRPTFEVADIPRVQGDRFLDRYRSSLDRKSTRLNSSHSQISYAVFCLKKKKKQVYDASILIRVCDCTQRHDYAVLYLRLYDQVLAEYATMLSGSAFDLLYSKPPIRIRA